MNYVIELITASQIILEKIEEWSTADLMLETENIERLQAAVDRAIRFSAPGRFGTGGPSELLIEYDESAEEATRALANYFVRVLAQLGHDPADVYRRLGYHDGQAFHGPNEWDLGEALKRAMKESEIKMAHS